MSARKEKMKSHMFILFGFHHFVSVLRPVRIYSCPHPSFITYFTTDAGFIEALSRLLQF